MTPARNPRVDYLRVYPGLNDFSDALEAIPQTLIGHVTHLKEIKAKSESLNPEIESHIRTYFKRRNPERLRKLSSALDKLIPAVGQKMHIAALAAEQVSHQLDRLNTDYRMICEHEIPKIVQIDNHDPAFVEIVPQEKQATLRSQARREAREAREARRATQQQESRASTPSSQVEQPVPTVGSRRRGRTATPQAFSAPAAAAAASDAHDIVAPVKSAAEPDLKRPTHLPYPEQNSSQHPQAQIAQFQPQQQQRRQQPLAAGQPHQKTQQLQQLQQQQEQQQQQQQQQAQQNLQSQQHQQTVPAELNIKPETAPQMDPSSQSYIPPVVMPIAADSSADKAADENMGALASPSTEGGAEVMIGLKRKRAAPKPSEPVYCYCQRASFGEMVACDGPHCDREWFHLGCIGLSAVPKGQWFCEECRTKLRRR